MLESQALDVFQTGAIMSIQSLRVFQGNAYNRVCEVYGHIGMCLSGRRNLEVEDIITSKNIT